MTNELLRATYMLEHIAAEVTLQRLMADGTEPRFDHGSSCSVCRLLVKQPEEKPPSQEEVLRGLDSAPEVKGASKS
jgi:hypothetical protein